MTEKPSKPKKTPRKRKTAAKSTESAKPGKAAPQQPKKIPQAHGGALMSGGTPGNRGGGGPPKAFKQFLGDLQRSPEAQEALKKVVTDPEHKNFAVGWQALTKFGPLDEGQAPMMTPEQALEVAARLFSTARQREIEAKAKKKKGGKAE